MGSGSHRGVGLAAEYLLPLRADRAPTAEFVDYLRCISELLPVVIVDSSPAEVFRAAHEALPFVRHLRPDPQLRCANGKVHNVLTGLRHVTAPAVVIADDDVRYDEAVLVRSVAALRDAELVRPQNYFDPLNWHAVWDTSRTLLNRATGGDFPGTLVVATAALRDTGGYDGDVLFENLELMRTIEAGGGRCVHRPDLFVRRLPPTSRHFIGQRVRQAYDELARPRRLAAQLGVVPVVAALVATRRWATLTGLAGAVVVVAELGRRRAGGRQHFPASAIWYAPGWCLERGVCAWVALWWRARGGVPYGGTRLVRAATPSRTLCRSLSIDRTAERNHDAGRHGQSAGRTPSSPAS